MTAQILLKHSCDMLVGGCPLVACGRKLLWRPLSAAASDPELLALCNSFPALLGRRTGQPEDLFHVHTAALEMLEEQLAHWPGGCPPLVLEANAGPGLLSRRLIEGGRLASHLRLFEHRECFLPQLRAQVSAWPARLELVEADLLRMHNREEQLLAGITPRPWTHAKRAKWIQAMSLVNVDGSLWQPSANSRVCSRHLLQAPEAVLVASLSRVREVGFLRYVLHQLPMGTSLFALGRLAFLLFLSHTEAAHITAARGSNFRHYRDVSILYQLFFHVDALGQVSRDYFLPPRGAKAQDTACRFWLAIVQRNNARFERQNQSKTQKTRGEIHTTTTGLSTELYQNRCSPSKASRACATASSLIT
ncbi:mitochondrial transcription factor B2 isoform X4 [Dermacentor variabilis]|uniref:mitochondrial transcription factor B2 isoform X4 n=1 Tax=Dermacentor variabilis TaxID=34621 RepID=UPI003F5C87CF